MADLSTLDASQPPDTQAVSQGAARIRETRDAAINSFGSGTGLGGTAAEHYLNGPHKFKSGNQAARPSTGNAGRIYINTTDNRLERDTGSVWNLLNVLPVYDSGLTAGPTTITTSFTTMASISTISVPSGCKFIIALMHMWFTNAVAAGQLFNGKFNFETLDISPTHVFATAAANASEDHLFMSVFVPSAPGNNLTLSYLALVGSGSGGGRNLRLTAIVV